MKAFCILFMEFWFTWSVVHVFAMAKSTEGADFRLQGTLANVNGTASASMVGSSSGDTASDDNNGNNTEVIKSSVLNHKHKVLLVVLSDLNLRQVKNDQQHVKSAVSKNGKVESNTVIVDENSFNEFLKKLNPITPNADNIECNDTARCTNILPHYVPPTYSLAVRKEERPPIVYVEPIVFETKEEADLDSTVLNNTKMDVDKTTNWTCKDVTTKRPENLYPPMFRANPSRAKRYRPNLKPLNYLLRTKFAVA